MIIALGVAALVAATGVGVAIHYHRHLRAWWPGFVERHIVADDPWQQSSPEQAEDQAMALANSYARHPSMRAHFLTTCPVCGRDIPRGPVEEHLCRAVTR